MIEFVDGPAKEASGTLCIGRAPLYLRVVRSGKSWDALDQLEDKIGPGEKAYAYRKIRDEGVVHLAYRCGRKRSGGLYQRGAYQFIENQPDQETMADNAKWQAWVLEEADKD